MHISKILVTLTSAICAIAMVFQVAFSLTGNPKPEIEESENQTATIVKNISAASNGITRKYSVIEKIPDSKAIKILTKTVSTAKTVTSADNVTSEATLPNLSTYKENSLLTTGTTTSAATDKSMANPLTSVESFLTLYKSGIKNLNVYLVDIGGGLKEFMAEYDNNLGEHQTFKSNIYYDEAKGLIYGNDNSGVFALGFDFDYGQMTIYSAKNSWMRNMGFCMLYDVLSPLISYNYKTVRVKFDYNDKDWMIQLWKGRYIITMGGEAGIYYKPKDRLVEFYDCAGEDGIMPMSLRLLKGNKVLFEREMQTCWWQTGFKLGELYLPMQLTLEGTIVFPNEVMRDKFTEAVDKLILYNIKYSVDGNAVSFVW